MRLSVIIPALNESEWIARAVGSAWKAGADEVIVVDGDSQDQTAEIAKQCGARVLQGPRGRSFQQNHGAQQAMGNVLLFLHADSWLAESVGDQVRECLENEKTLGGAFWQQIDASGCLYRLLERGNAARVRWCGIPYGDQAIFMRRNVFEQLGGFPSVKLMEDLILMRKFRKMSCPVLLPGPVFVHPRRWQQQGVVRQTLRNWSLLSAHALGVAPDKLARYYPLHNGSPKNLD